MEDRPLGRREGEAAGVGDRVGDREELGGDGRAVARGPDVAGHDLAEVGLDARLREAGPQEREGEARAVDRYLHLAQEEGERAHVVLVTVGEEDRADPLPPLPEPPEVRGDDVDAHRLVREHDPAVHDGDPPVALDRHAVHADLAEAAERDDADGRRHPRNLPRAGCERRGEARGARAQAR